MKTVRMPRLIGALALSTVGSAVMAATTTTTFDVTATVVDSCSVSATNLAFGNVEPVNGSLIDATSTVTVTCSLGTGYAIALDTGLYDTDGTVNTRRMKNSASEDYLSYQLYSTLGSVVWGETSGTDDVTGTGTGLGIPETVFGRIPAGQETTRTGSYADTIGVTVTY